MVLCSIIFKMSFSNKIIKIKFLKLFLFFLIFLTAHCSTVSRSLFVANFACFNVSSNTVHENLLKSLIVISEIFNSISLIFASYSAFLNKSLVSTVLITLTFLTNSLHAVLLLSLLRSTSVFILIHKHLVLRQLNQLLQKYVSM